MEGEHRKWNELLQFVDQSGQISEL
jgi:hypothetical protein